MAYPSLVPQDQLSLGASLQNPELAGPSGAAGVSPTSPKTPNFGQQMGQNMKGMPGQPKQGAAEPPEQNMSDFLRLMGAK